MIRPLLIYPDERLEIPAHKVGTVTPAIMKLIEDMTETMYAEGGIGISAPQVGTSLRIFLIDLSQGARAKDLKIFIDPEEPRKEGTSSLDWEGCLSFPDVRERIGRASMVHVTAYDLDGQKFTTTATGLYARAVQHEYDHLDGRLMVDLMNKDRRAKSLAVVRRSARAKLAKAWEGRWML